MRIEKITTDEQLQQAFKIRREVFVDEQGVNADEEYDQYDNLGQVTEHILAYYNDEPAGTGRLRVVGDTGKLERICILKPYRSYGLGKAITAGLEDLAKQRGLHKVKLHGQVQAQPFYEKLGYAAASDIFYEADIPHVLMLKQI